MVTATFRFYGKLNTFIAPARRERAFDSVCARAATTKHMIEALGVPHTEVDLLLVNGESAPFTRLLQHGDQLAVYPALACIDGAASLVRAPPLAALRFSADAHLGGLARLLRMAGFDTLYDNAADDAALVADALQQQRMVLTRDRDLLIRKEVTHGCYVHALKSVEQLQELAERLDLAGAARPFTLCLHCNAPLRKVDPASVAAQLPPAVRAAHMQYQSCDVCHGVFWKGSHWQHMARLLARSGMPEGLA